MRNVGLSKLQNLLFVLLLFALTGCGASNSNIAGPADNPSGKITAKFDLAADGKSSAKSVAAPANVVSFRLRITGPYQIPGNTTTASRYTAVKATFPASAGSASVAVTPGTGLTVIAEALDAGDTVLYEGIATTLNGSPINVVAGSTTDLGTITLKAPPVKEADKPCLSCHENSRDSNGNSLVANYKSSRHYNITTSPAAKYGVNSVGCAGCHGPAHNDLNPATSGRCAECHTQATGFGPEQGVGSLSANHYALPARYLDAAKGNCSACHQPHNQATGNAERVAWAESGHGNTAAPPWVPSASHYWRITGSDADFLTGNPASDCLRCHTADGFVQFVSSGYTNVKNLPGDSTLNSPLNCNACHTDNEFTLRKATEFATNFAANGGVGVNGVAGNSFVNNNLIPDLGESNICVPCHSGRGSQDIILKLTDAQIANTSFKNGHYMPAAGIMFMKTGFTNFTSAATVIGTSTYGKSYSLPLTYNTATPPAFVRGGVDAKYGGVVGGVTSAHRGLGTQTILKAETWLTDPATFNGNKGPCVTCHINANTAGMPPVSTTAAAPFLSAGTVIPAKRAGSGHSLSAVNADTGKQLCMPCHNDEKDFDTAINAGNFAAANEEKLAEAKPYFKAGLAVMAKLLDTKYNVTFDNAAYPYFFKKGVTPAVAVTDWTVGGKLTPVQARKFMGACYNLKMLSADEGAYVHGRTYVQRLIFDSIDFLDDGIINSSSADTIVALGDPKLFPSKVADHWLFKAAGVRK